MNINKVASYADNFFEMPRNNVSRRTRYPRFEDDILAFSVKNEKKGLFSNIVSKVANAAGEFIDKTKNIFAVKHEQKTANIFETENIIKDEDLFENVTAKANVFEAPTRVFKTHAELMQEQLEAMVKNPDESIFYSQTRNPNRFSYYFNTVKKSYLNTLPEINSTTLKIKSILKTLRDLERDENIDTSILKNVKIQTIGTTRNRKIIQEFDDFGNLTRKTEINGKSAYIEDYAHKTVIYDDDFHQYVLKGVKWENDSIVSTDKYFESEKINGKTKLKFYEEGVQYQGHCNRIARRGINYCDNGLNYYERKIVKNGKVTPGINKNFRIVNN